MAFPKYSMLECLDPYSEDPQTMASGISLVLGLRTRM